MILLLKFIGGCAIGYYLIFGLAMRK